jgi:nondiscriminating aspartyl-tRNA synthetase
MATTTIERQLVRDIVPRAGVHVQLRGWVHRLRVLSTTTFVVLRDCTGEIQCVAGTERIASLQLKLEDTVQIVGRIRPDARARGGYEVDVDELRVLNAAGHRLPFHPAADLDAIGSEARLDYRPLAARNDRIGSAFRIQGVILEQFRAFLRDRDFTEIVTPKILASGSEGGTNLFAVDYFGRTAYLAQSPQLYKEHGVAAFERVFETGHVFRAEPHASSRHLTEYYSLDVELGFIDGAADLIALEKAMLSSMFAHLNAHHGDVLERHGAPCLPAVEQAPVWEFDACLEKLASAYGVRHLVDDLDPQAERQLCALAERETGIPAVFVIGFPLSARPFYTAPRMTASGTATGAAESFDLLLRGVEITTGGQRLHCREALETALRERGMDLVPFEHHLRMFELGMPPHGGFAIGLERLTARILELANVRDVVLYPRDRQRLSP